MRETDGGTSRVTGPAGVDALRCSPLNWAPPRLAKPRTIRLTRAFDMVKLDPGRDYVLRLPQRRKLGGTFVEGGRNVVVRGGHISLPPGTSRDEERRALYFKNQTGTVHVEGVLIDGSGGGEGDGIALSAPLATVQIENTRIEGLRGSEGGTHGDLVQPWGGVGELRIDRLSGSSRFQGLQLPVTLGPIGGVHIRFADLRAMPAPTRVARQGLGTGGHMLWLTPPGSCSAFTVALDQVYVAPRRDRSLRDSVWPGVGDGSACAAVGDRKTVRWPGLPVRGEVLAGRPAGGDWVPRALLGRGYRSPGYATAPETTAGGLFTTLRALACLALARACEE